MEKIAEILKFNMLLSSISFETYVFEDNNLKKVVDFSKKLKAKDNSEGFMYDSLSLILKLGNEVLAFPFELPLSRLTLIIS